MFTITDTEPTSTTVSFVLYQVDCSQVIKRLMQQGSKTGSLVCIWDLQGLSA
jgi:hypothetical protein